VLKALILRYLITLAGVVAAVILVPGITIAPNKDGLFAVGVMALILCLVNVLLKPILTMLSCGFIVLTLGLFMLVINSLALWIASWLASLFGIGFVVDGFWAAFWGGLVISVVSFVANMIVPDH